MSELVSADVDCRRGYISDESTSGETYLYDVRHCTVRMTASWMSDYLAVKPSAVGQPTWPTQPSIPQGSVNE